MKHLEALTKIYFTMEYKMFHLLKGNRTLNKKKIQKIIADIEGGTNWLPYCPIIVDADMNVIDGQHRLEVAKQMKSNIWYVIADAATLYSIAKMNTNTERWKPKDFINCYKEQGNKHYEELEKFMEKHRFPITTSLYMLMYGKVQDGTGSNIKEKYEAGEFECRYADKANSIAKMIYRCKDYDGFLGRAFIVALTRVMEAGKADVEELMTKFHKNHTPLEKCKSVKDYMNALEAIYNLGNKFRRVIF